MKISQIKRMLALLLCVMLFGTSLTSYASFGNMDATDEGELDKYPIDEPYEYPVVPGTDEWKALDNNIDKLRVCMIPEDILRRMTTEALLESLLSYPMMVNMFVWEVPQKGYEYILRNFNGLQELVEREDFGDVLDAYSRESISVYSSMDEGEVNIAEEALGIIAFYQEHPITQLVTMNPLILSPTALGTEATVYTPNGTAVIAWYNITYSEWGAEATEYLLNKKAQKYAELYPNAVLISPRSASYNCHSYAWFSNGSPSNYWIHDMRAYVEDDSYVQVAPPYMGGEIVLYMDNNLSAENAYTHSAIFVDSASSTYISKWGYHAAYRHALYDCPFYEDATHFTYWRR